MEHDTESVSSVVVLLVQLLSFLEEDILMKDSVSFEEDIINLYFKLSGSDTNSFKYKGNQTPDELYNLFLNDVEQYSKYILKVHLKP